MKETLNSSDIIGQQRSIEYGTESVNRIFTMIPNLFLQIFYDYYTSIDNVLWANRKMRADKIATLAYGKQTFASALIKMIQLEDYFQKVIYRLPFSEENFFERFQCLVDENSKELLRYREKVLKNSEAPEKAHPSLNMRIELLPSQKDVPENPELKNKILKDLYPQELRLSLIYQHYRDIHRYYGELIKILKDYKGVIPELELSERIFSLFRGSEEVTQGGSR